MSPDKLDQEIAVRLSNSNMETLRFLTESWDMSLSEVIRTLIPSIPKLNTAKVEKRTGPLTILEDIDFSRLSELINELLQENQAVTLAKELKALLVDSKHVRDKLTGTTEKRLLRWADPFRDDDRTRFVKPRAQKICNILYGFVPKRND